MPPVVETSRVYMRRLALKHRNIYIQRNQNDLHRKKKKRESRKLTPEERKARTATLKKNKTKADELLEAARGTLWDKCLELAGELGKSPEHWQRTLMQGARISAESKTSSRWNVYQSLRLGQINDGRLAFRVISRTVTSYVHRFVD